MTVQHYHAILDYIRDLIDGTQWQGHVYAVGGCCRDEILGCEIKDVDLAVELPGGGILFAQWLFEKGLTIKEPVTFPAFGTAMLRLHQFPDDEIEIVQTRAEKYTDKTRRDPTVVFGSIDADCRRRDLTINALYYDISAQRLLDLLGTCLDDIHNRIIRTPADPDETFDDDPVRILRAVRLAARYNWPIEEKTFEAMKRNAERLQIVRPQRMQAEIEKMLTGPNPTMAMDLLRRCDAMPHIFPELCPMFDLEQSDIHIGTVWQHTLAVLEKVPPVAVLRVAALFHDVGKTRSARIGRDGRMHFPAHERQCKGLINTALRRLFFDSDFINKVIFLVANHKAAKRWGAHAEHMSLADLRKLQHRCASRERMARLLCLIDADNNSFAPGHGMPHQAAEIERRSEELVKAGTAMFSYRLPLPASKIRKIKNLQPDDDIKPYVDFILRQAYDNPRAERATFEKSLRGYTPKSAGKSNATSKPATEENAAPQKAQSKKRHRKRKQ